MELEERSADPLAGGIMRGYQCGMIWGATLAAGAQTYRTLGKGPQAEVQAMLAAQRIVEAFRAQNKNINCRDITGIDMSAPTPWMILRFLINTGAKGTCFGMAGRYAPAAFSELNAAFSEEQMETPSTPMSCSAMLAKRMSASDVQTIMAAGLAGGIGLSGGACGALGAAIWIGEMNSLKEGGDIGLKAPAALDAIERFVKFTSGEFECSKIVGRKFESVDDHASYVRAGGCSEIIEVLAAQRS